jgi:hypothetical protein
VYYFKMYIRGGAIYMRNPIFGGRFIKGAEVDATGAVKHPHRVIDRVDLRQMVPVRLVEGHFVPNL